MCFFHTSHYIKSLKLLFLKFWCVTKFWGHNTPIFWSNSSKEPMLTPCLELGKCQENLINKQTQSVLLLFIQNLSFWCCITICFYSFTVSYKWRKFSRVERKERIMKSLNMFYESSQLLFWSFRYKHILGCGSFYNTLVSHEPKRSSTQTWF